MQAESTARAKGTGTILAVSLLLFGSCPALGQAPGSNLRRLHPAPLAAGTPANPSRPLPADVEQAIGWLPDNTESIIVARGPLMESTLKDIWDRRPFIPSGVVPPPEPDFQQQTLAGSLSLFKAAGNAFVQSITRQPIHFVIASARQFGPPVIGSGSTFEGCELIVFDHSVPDVAVRGAGQTVSVEHIENNQVVRVDSQWGGQDKKVSIYYAKPKPNTLIATNNRGSLKTILQRITRLGATRTPLLEFPEWKCVDTQSLVWGIRHRRTATPFNFTVFRDDGSFASKLVGITFSYQAKPTESVMLQFHCTDKPQNVLPKVIGEDFRTEQISPLVAEARVRINRRRATTAIEQSPQNRGHYSGSEMQFRIAWFMGYVVCP